MKKIITLLLFLLCSNTSFAQNLCDASCNLTISFTGGGGINAVESVNIIFGVGGVLDLGATGTINSAVPPASTDFSAGGVLLLAAGESITFDLNGSLDLGVGGNISYTDMSISAIGELTIEAVGGLGAITISSMYLNVDSITILSDTNIESDLTLGGIVAINGTGSLVNNGVLNIGLNTVTLGTNLNMSNGTIDISSGTLDISTGGSMILSGGQIMVGTTLTTYEVSFVNALPVLSGGTITLSLLKEVTIDGAMYTSDDGITFVSPEGATGSIAFKDGAFVFASDEPASDEAVPDKAVPDEAASVVGGESSSSGASDFWLVFGLPLLAFLLRRKHQVSCFSMR